MSQTEINLLIYNLLRSTNLSEENQGLRKLTRLVKPLVSTFVLRNNGSVVEADDLVQDVVISVWENVRKGSYSPQPGKPLEAYVRTLIRNQWFKQLRDQKKELALVGVDLADEPPEETDLDGVLLALNRLDGPCQQILTWYYLEQMNLTEIAQRLGKTYGAVKEQKYRCLLRLKELF